MRELSLHLLDIAENSVAAGAKTVEIEIAENSQIDRLRMTVCDNGRGMDADLLARVTDPFVTSRTTRKVGLGIPLLKAAAEGCNGFLNISSAPGQGTCLEVEFQHSHIDRMPLGDLAATLLNLVITEPDIRWVIHYQVDDREFYFDSQPIREELEGVSFSEPVVLAFIRDLFSDGIARAQSTSPLN